MSLPSSRSPLVALLVLAACSRGDAAVSTSRAEAQASTPARMPDVPLPHIAASAAPYVVDSVVNGGSVSGYVELPGDAPADSTVAPSAALAPACATAFVDRTIERRGVHVAGVIVWLEGVTRGKSLPSDRRYEVTLDECRLAPRAQPAMVGGTVQFHSTDPLRALVRLVRWPGATTLSTIATNDAGQVVPVDGELSEVGLVEVQGVQPAWLRSWILAFDHPYWTTSRADGAYTIGDVPAGSYRLVAWHERFGRIEQPVTVVAGQASTMVVRLAPQPTPSP